MIKIYVNPFTHSLFFIIFADKFEFIDDLWHKKTILRR